MINFPIICNIALIICVLVMAYEGYNEVQRIKNSFSAAIDDLSMRIISINANAKKLDQEFSELSHKVKAYYTELKAVKDGMRKEKITKE